VGERTLSDSGRDHSKVKDGMTTKDKYGEGSATGFGKFYWVLELAASAWAIGCMGYYYYNQKAFSSLNYIDLVAQVWRMLVG